MKCDGTLPFCNNCNTIRIQCSYKESTKKRGPPKGYVEAIEGRLHRLEALLGSVIKEDDPRSQAILSELRMPLQTAYGQLIRPKAIEKDTMKQMVNDSRDSIQSISSIEEDDISKIDESGQLRYYGKSSGFYMLQTSKSVGNKMLHFNSKKRPSIFLNVDPYEMPPKDLSDSLLYLYFRNYYVLLPLVHKRFFMQTLEKNQVPPLLLNSIYAIASRVSSDPRVRADKSKPETAGDIFFERAKILLDLEWDNFKVYTVQALLLLSSHQNGALKTTRGWLYSGMAIRMSQNLGLHRNCDSWDISELEKEERKRVFYCCFVVDRLASAMHGRSPMIDERDYDSPLPYKSPEDSDVIKNFYYLIQICEILGEVIRELYMVKGRQHLSNISTPDNVISSLDKKLNKWMARLPPELQYRLPGNGSNKRLPVPSIELCQMHMLFYTTLILTHRPFIPGHEKGSTQSVFPSASICTFAANKILHITESLLAESRLTDINNYALFFMFTAGIIFIYNASLSDEAVAAESKHNVNKIMNAMDEVEKIWSTSSRHCNILGALAGLREIDLERVDESYTQSQRKSKEPMIIPRSPNINSSQIEEKYYLDSTSEQSFKSPQAIQNDYDFSFNPNAKDFFEIPMSFNVDEWNNYFNHQKANFNEDGSVFRHNSTFNNHNMYTTHPRC
ncbi:fungal-specific transcription factor domain-containing protein [Sporodiniella umbellata]|nr:fungal-specific transcription factor domain-containing protein [Sporodiniella umbellata]